MSVELSRLVCSALLNVLTRNGKSTKPRLLSAADGVVGSPVRRLRPQAIEHCHLCREQSFHLVLRRNPFHHRKHEIECPAIHFPAL
jgi:hypothetical protein